MKKIARIIFTVGSALMCLSAANAGIPNNNDPITFIGPTAKGSFSSLLSESTAFSVAGEAGARNFRVGGTLGWRMAGNQRLKLSADYLWQEIGYSFFSGDTNQWVNQGSISAAYQYLFDYMYRPAFDLSIYYSHASSKRLHNVSGIFFNPLISPFPQIFINSRRIAGSNAGGISPGVSLHPWVGGKAGIELNYDDVRYDTHVGRNKNANGLGGTIKLRQMVIDNIEVGASAAFRQPFNNYAADVAWTNVPYFGNWTLGLFGNYTAGKNSLPSTWNLGLSADYIFDSCIYEPRSNLKGDFKNEGPLALPTQDDLVQWTSDPAVYLPQVLAVTDQRVERFDVRPIIIPQVCAQGIPQFLGALGGGTFPSLSTQTINAAPNFTGTGLIFSVVATQVGGLGTSTVTINPATGVLTLTGLRSTTNITVTATNICGSATSNTFVVTFGVQD